MEGHAMASWSISGDKQKELLELAQAWGKLSLGEHARANFSRPTPTSHRWRTSRRERYIVFIDCSIFGEYWPTLGHMRGFINQVPFGTGMPAADAGEEKVS